MPSIASSNLGPGQTSDDTKCLRKLDLIPSSERNFSTLLIVYSEVSVKTREPSNYDCHISRAKPLRVTSRRHEKVEGALSKSKERPLTPTSQPELVLKVVLVSPSRDLKIAGFEI